MAEGESNSHGTDMVPFLAESDSCQEASLFIPIFLITIGLSAMAVFFRSVEPIFYLFLALVLTGWIPIAVGMGKIAMWASHQNAPLPNKDWQPPKVTILLPVYGEDNMMQQLADAMAAIHYPTEQLQCLVLLEHDDVATIHAAINTRWPDFCALVSVPRGRPQTKARACNHGLARANGEYLVIFDAEDKPHPDQIMGAVRHFASADPKLVCLQAPLHIEPQAGRWLQAQFALEYRLLFYVILPCLGHSCGALPLGESSNYFHTKTLRTLGGWDAYNLTEDADLGIRLAKFGYRTSTISLPTIENAPHYWPVWHHQRTRWLSGHIQTLYAHRYFWRTSKARILNMLACRFILISRLLSGPTHGLALYMATRKLMESGFDVFVSNVSWLFIAPYATLLILVYFLAPGQSRMWRLFLALTHGLYWLLTLLPFLNACKRMALGQLNWLKTPHTPYNDESHDDSHYDNH